MFARTLARITRGVLAVALIASIGSAVGGAFTQPETAALPRADAGKTTRPLNNDGEKEVRNTPVVFGRN